MGPKALPTNGGLTYEFIVGDATQQHAITSPDEDQNPWLKIMNSTLLNQFDIKTVLQIFPAATDSR